MVNYRVSGLLVAALWVGGCGETNQTPPTADAGGSAGSAGGSAGAAAGAAGAASNASGANQAGAAGSAVACPEVVSAQAGTAPLELTTALYFGDAELSPGQPNTLPSGSVLTPLNVRFYVSHVELLHADGSAVPADLVSAAGAVEPYGVHLVNTDDDNALHLHLRGAEGSYTGVRFLLGLDNACNGGSLERRAPLSATSGMVWPPPFGYLFLRYEGQFSPDAKDTSMPPGAIHMGGLIDRLLAPTVSAAGAFTLANGSPTQRSLHLAVDKMFEAATSSVDIGEAVPLPPGNEVQAGERLRLSAATTPLFSLVEP